MGRSYKCNDLDDFQVDEYSVLMVIRIFLFSSIMAIWTDYYMDYMDFFRNWNYAWKMLQI